MTTIDSRPSTFDLSRVIQRTFSVIGKNFVPFLLAALVLVGVPAVLAAVAQGNDANFLVFQPWQWTLLVIAWIISIVGSYLLQAAIVFSTVQTLSGRTATLQNALHAGVRHLVPLVLLAILVFVCVMIGSFLLVVPGVILAILWCVAGPALVVEKRSIFGSLQRSRDLTRGHRWAIFGLIVIYLIVYMIISTAVGAVGGALGGGFTPGATPNLLAFNIVISPLIAITQGIIGSAGVAAIYYELRTAKEGVGAEQMASVFD